jgi:hypothetical protein
MGEACRTLARDQKYVYNYDRKRRREERNHIEDARVDVRSR